MIIGHTLALEYLKKAFMRNAVPHALFFWGPKEVGKRTIAEEFAKGFFCEKGSFLGCGECDGCSAENAIHKDHVINTREMHEAIEEETDSIGIETILAIQRKIQESSLVGKPRIVIIDGVESVTPTAWNALLKTLEEPPADVYFILIGETKDSVLPTILSRSVPLRFSLVSLKDIEAYLAENHGKLSENERASFARFSGGRPGRLLKGLEDPAVMKAAQQKLSVAFSILSNPLYASLQKIDELAKKEEPLDEYPDYLFLALRSLFLMQYEAPNSYTLKIPEALSKSLSTRYPGTLQAKAINKLFTVNNLLKETNVNRRMALESFVIELP